MDRGGRPRYPGKVTGCDAIAGWHEDPLEFGPVLRDLLGPLGAVLDAGLAFVRFAEGGAPTPTVFAWRARKPA